MLINKFQDELKTAMKAHDETCVSTLRLLIAALHNEQIAKMHALKEDEELVVLAKQAKQRRDSIEQYKKGNRDDLVKTEQAELTIIESYLPKQMSEEEITVVAKAKMEELGITSAAGTGKLMGSLMGELKGKADGAAVKKVVSQLLSSPPKS